MAMLSCAQGQFTFTTNNGTLTISGYSGSYTNLVIPSKTNGMSVVAIADYALWDDGTHGMLNVVIPNTITSIGVSAFQGNVWLKSVIIPNSVTYLGDNTFDYCASMTKAVIGAGVTNLNGSTFAQCYSLQSVYFLGNAQTNVGVFWNGSNVKVYYMPGKTGWSSIFAGTAAFLWNPQFLTDDGNFGIRTNRLGFTVAGTMNIPIALEVCTNLTNASWQQLQTCTLTNGVLYLIDTNKANFPVRLYRINSP